MRWKLSRERLCDKLTAVELDFNGRGYPMIGTGLAFFIASVLGLAVLGLILAFREPQTPRELSGNAVVYGAMAGGAIGASGASGESGGTCSGGGDCG